MTKQVTLGLALHNHQPVGNFPWVFEEAYRHAYLPMLECLERHPAIRVSLHYSGPLLDWLVATYPAFLRRLAGLVSRGQVEMMTGGYYEPILPAIPEADRIGQIRKMTEFIDREFGTTATGMWLAERVWEPQLPTTLFHAGVEWTIVDDTHFKMVGLTDDDLTGYYLTEDQGYPVKVFATSKRLRYVIPWADVSQVIDELGRAAGDDPSLIAVMGDDGEKFGVWPGTYDYCWTRGWMDRFFEAIEANRAWIRVVPVGEYARSHRARGRIYLPTASYAEMLEWALPAGAGEEFTRVVHEMQASQREDVVRFLRGGFWRNFLVKYEEVNTMHKKMLRVHRKVYPSEGSPDPVALDELWQGQCNCPYWHGVFGGIYMTDVRAATFRHLIRSETRADALRHGDEDWIAHQVVDFDQDSRDELLVESSRANYYLAPELGGTLVEWDTREGFYNLTSVMTRRPEAYHATLRQASAASASTDDSGAVKTIHDVVRIKEPGLAQLLHYDWYRRACLVDHFLPAGTSASAFADQAYAEAGDFVGQPYRVTVGGQGTERIVTLTRDGQVADHASPLSVTVEKTLRFVADDPGFVAIYRLVNRAEQSLTSTFGVELNLNLLGGGGNPAAYRRLVSATVDQAGFDQNGEAGEVRQVVAGNSYLGLEVSFTVSRPATAWWATIDSVSSSEGGFERVHQGSSLLFSWPVHLPPGGEWTAELRAAVAVARRSERDRG